MINEIEEVINKKIRPYLLEHYGDIKVLEAKNGLVKVKMLGGCAGCPSAKLTVSEIVETKLKEEIPGIKAVEIDESISDEMWKMAKKILNEKIKL